MISLLVHSEHLGTVGRDNPNDGGVPSPDSSLQAQVNNGGVPSPDPALQIDAAGAPSDGQAATNGGVSGPARPSSGKAAASVSTPPVVGSAPAPPARARTATVRLTTLGGETAPRHGGKAPSRLRHAHQ